MPINSRRDLSLQTEKAWDEVNKSISPSQSIPEKIKPGEHVPPGDRDNPDPVHKELFAYIIRYLRKDVNTLLDMDFFM